jgi:hypothetical protein
MFFIGWPQLFGVQHPREHLKEKAEALLQSDHEQEEEHSALRVIW